MTTGKVIEILADIKEYYGEIFDGVYDDMLYGCEILPLTDIEREAMDKAIEMLKELKGEAEGED